MPALKILFIKKNIFFDVGQVENGGGQFSSIVPVIVTSAANVGVDSVVDVSVAGEKYEAHVGG